MLALLRSFDDSRSEQGVTELARAIGVHKSTASRLAAVLERAGLLSRHGRRYRLGLEIIRLGTLALHSFDVVAALGPALAELSRRTGETVSLAVPGESGSDIRHVAEIPGTFFVSCTGGRTGRWTRPHAVASGKVLMAYGAIGVPRRLERYTEQTITDQAALRSELAAVRASGWAAAVSELEDGLVAVAAPVFDTAGACVAALSVSGPALRLTPDSLAELGELCAACVHGALARPARQARHSGPGRPAGPGRPTC